MTRGEVMRCEHAREAGAYVLGALSPAERMAYERHLSACPQCRQAVAEIAVLPGLLGRLDPAAAGQIAGGGGGAGMPESRLPKLVEAAARRRRRDAWVRRWRLAGATAAAAGVAVLASLGLAPGREAAPPAGDRQVAMAEMTEVDDTPVIGKVGLVRVAGGTEVRMHCEYPRGAGQGPSAYTYRLVAVGADGTKEQVGSWMARPGSDLRLSGVTHFAYDDIVRLELQRNSGDPLLVYHVR